MRCTVWQLLNSRTAPSGLLPGESVFSLPGHLHWRTSLPLLSQWRAPVDQTKQLVIGCDLCPADLRFLDYTPALIIERGVATTRYDWYSQRSRLLGDMVKSFQHKNTSLRQEEL